MQSLAYLDVIEDLLVFVFFVAFLGVVYQLAGAFIDERASRLASLMHVMGCTRAARIVYVRSFILSASHLTGLSVGHGT